MSYGKPSLVPTSTQNCLYLAGDTANLTEIIEAARGHFGPDVEFDDLRIGREHYHARCIGYDLYDPQDYDDYITIERTSDV